MKEQSSAHTNRTQAPKLQQQVHQIELRHDLPPWRPAHMIVILTMKPKQSAVMNLAC